MLIQAVPVLKLFVTHQASKVDWQSPSEKKPYPDVNAYPDMWIKVSASIASILWMIIKFYIPCYCSTGSKGQETPKRDFWNSSWAWWSISIMLSLVKANYWVSFKDHGIYLFHTVPVDANGNYVVSEAEQLEIK